MKLIKISLLILAPIGLAAMFGNTVYIQIQNHFLNLSDFTDTGCENAIYMAKQYVPLVCAFSFFAFWAFLVPTANLLFPDATNSIETVKAPVMRPAEPCIMQVVRIADYNKSVYSNLNIC